MSWTAERARVAALARHRHPDDPDLVTARGALKAARIADNIRDLVADPTPLTDTQRMQLTSLLLGGAA